MIPMIVKRAAERIFDFEAAVAKKWASGAHKRLLGAQWGLKPSPEHFDHSIDLYYQWSATGISLWLERGVFGVLAMKGGPVLELACGDGFNAKHFYSNMCESIIACDFDPEAIRTAKRKNKAANIRYVLADIRTEMPQGQFTNVIWDAAIEHFTPEEIDAVLGQIKTRLLPGGVLSGYTMVERHDGKKALEEHEYEFVDMADLRRFLTPHFANVTVFETIHPSRHNLYFWASDEVIPFSKGWPHMITSEADTPARKTPAAKAPVPDLTPSA